jgi:hypothetical protein
MGGTLSQGADEERQAPADGPAAPHPAAPDGPAGMPSRRGRVPDVITRAGGLLSAAVGLTVIAAWYVRATAILRFGSQNPMSFNTALAFVVTGVRSSRWPGLGPGRRSRRACSTWSSAR